MSVARIVWWSFKPGMRDEAVSKIDGLMDEIKSNEGYQGFLMLLSSENPDRATVVSIWDSEKNMSAAERSQYPRVVNEVSGYLVKTPHVAHQSVHAVDLARIYA